MKFRSRHLAAFAFTVAVASSASALAQTPDDFVKTQHGKLETILRQPDSGAKDTQIASTLDSMIDYDALAKRAFGEPCPVAGCTDHWPELSADQRTEITSLLKTLVQKNYKKNLNRTLNYDVKYSGAVAQGQNFEVHTEAKNKVDAREPVVFIDYLLAGASGGPYRVVDIVTERSSLTKNYYDSFHKYLTTPGQGYPYLKQKVVDKTAKL